MPVSQMEQNLIQFSKVDKPCLISLCVLNYKENKLTARVFALTIHKRIYLSADINFNVTVTHMHVKLLKICARNSLADALLIRFGGVELFVCF